MNAPDPADIAAPHEAAPPGRPVSLGPVFFAFIGFGVICVLGGVFFALAVPRLFPAHPAAPAVARPAAAAPVASIDARLADIQARLAAAPPAAPAGAPLSAPGIDALADRVARLEAGQQRLMDAASGALAAAALTQAAQGSRPFAGELGALEAALPDSLDVRALRPLAETGAPTAAALAAEYPEFAARAAVSARARASGEGLFARIAQALAAIVTVRRVDRLDGSGADAVLARAQRRVGDGDLAGADVELNALSSAGREAMEPWRKAARRRVEIERRVQAIRSAALAELAHAGAQLRPAAPSAPAPATAAPPVPRAPQGPPA